MSILQGFSPQVLSRYRCLCRLTSLGYSESWPAPQGSSQEKHAFGIVEEHTVVGMPPYNPNFLPYQSKIWLVRLHVHSRAAVLLVKALFRCSPCLTVLTIGPSAYFPHNVDSQNKFD